MWTLLLSRQGDPPGQYLDRRQIDSGQIRIGRSAGSCDWVIPDTQGHISREHCAISAIGLDLFVVDSSTNGVALNQPMQRVAPQQPVAVRIGDRLILGEWVIEVASEAAGFGASLAPAPAAAADPAAAFHQPDAWFDQATPTDPIWGAGASQAEVHEFLGSAMHDFLAPPAAAPMGGGGGFDPFAGGALGEAFSKPLLAQPVSASDAALAIPADWAMPAAPARSAPSPAPPMAPSFPPAATPHDPFAGLDALGPFPPLGEDDPFAPPGGAPPRAAPDPFGAPAADPFGDAVPPAADPFGVPPPADPFGERAPTAGISFAAAADPFASAAPGAADDPFALPARPATPPTADPFASHEATPERTRPPVAAPATPAAPPPAATPGAADWAAFCEGAGLDPAELRTSPDAMRRLGVLYRQVVLGLSDLIQDRAAFKDEFRVERTQLSFGRNNPLKHLPPLDSAKLLLADPLPGFMGAEDAVHAALEDVKKHQLALLAGVQHALRAVFQRLAPAEVDRVMKQATAERRGLSLRRGIDPWSVYQTMFEALRRDATSNVNSVMSVAFREGYEQFLRGGQA